MQKENLPFSCSKPLIQILWDASPLWGHLVLNAVIQTGLSYSIIRTTESNLTYEEMRKKFVGKILIVPGGFGRMKEEILGEQGKKAICDFVADGGVYIGFCGGAGLALSHNGVGLGLCPWGRGVYNSRLEHLISGHLISSMNSDTLFQNNTEIALPVWWPGRFQEPLPERKEEVEKGQPVRVLARYKAMGKDLYVADIPLTKLPQTVFEDWENLYGVTLLPHLLNNEPLVISGDYGKGKYYLSYSHLETPDSLEANAFFAQILCSCIPEIENREENNLEKNDKISMQNAFYTNDIESRRDMNAARTIFNSPYKPVWLAKLEGGKVSNPLLLELYKLLEELFVLAVDLHLLFVRNDWLYGWQTSIPGSQLNALRVALLQSLFLKQDPKRDAFFAKNSAIFDEKLRIFVNGAKTWFLARKLSEVMGGTPEKGYVSKAILQEQRKELFGLHMSGGGLCGELIEWLNELLFCTE